MTPVESGADEIINEAGLWRQKGWTAQVMKNGDDDGWAVAMTRDGEAEPALIGPWTMGRDKKNPKPLDATAFNTLVKTATEFLRRSEQQRYAQLHRKLSVSTPSGSIVVSLDIIPDDDEPSAELSAEDAFGEELARVPVRPDFKLNTASALDWIENDYRKPR